MPTVPPINRRELRKAGLFDNKRFFGLLSEKNNYMDPKTMEQFYMGFVRAISKELKEKGVVNLPHLGQFALVKVKDKLGWAGKVQQIIKGKYVLKFYPNELWNKYMTTKREDITGYEAGLDPREKVLNIEIE